MEVKLRRGGHGGANRDAWEGLEAELRSHFPRMELGEAFSDRRAYNLPRDGVGSLAEAFKALEESKN